MICPCVSPAARPSAIIRWAASVTMRPRMYSPVLFTQLSIISISAISSR